MVPFTPDPSAKLRCSDRGHALPSPARRIGSRRSRLAFPAWFTLFCGPAASAGCNRDCWNHEATAMPLSFPLTADQPTASYTARMEFYSDLRFRADFEILFFAVETGDPRPGAAVVTLEPQSISGAATSFAPDNSRPEYALLSGTTFDCRIRELCIIELDFNVRLAAGQEATVNGGGSVEMSGQNGDDLGCAMAWIELDGPAYP